MPVLAACMHSIGRAVCRHKSATALKVFGMGCQVHTCRTAMLHGVSKHASDQTSKSSTRLWCCSLMLVAKSLLTERTLQSQAYRNTAMSVVRVTEVLCKNRARHVGTSYLPAKLNTVCLCCCHQHHHQNQQHWLLSTCGRQVSTPFLPR